MKKRISLLLTVLIVLQAAGFVAVQADEVYLNEGFDNGFVFDTVGEANDYQNYQIVAGEFLKPKGDKSLRLYSKGGNYQREGNLYVVKNIDAQNAASNEYVHLSFEYLTEDLMSGTYIQIRVNYTKDGAGGSDYTDKFPFDIKNKNMSIFGGSANSTYRPGQWNKVDLYFEGESSMVYVYVNGQMQGGGGIEWNTDAKLFTSVNALRITHLLSKTGDEYNKSAIQFDNIIVEKVSSLPSSVDYAYMGEVINFDDGIDSTLMTDGRYNVFGMEGNLVRRFEWTGRPAARFWSVAHNTFESGVYGKPAWDQSLFGEYTANNQGLQYNTGAALKAGDIGHLTMMFANRTNYSFRLDSKLFKFNDTAQEGTAYFVEFPNNYANIKFFTLDSGVAWEQYRWYKLDWIFKVGDGATTYTQVDCYIDGVKVISDYEWKPADGSYDVLTYIGDLYFLAAANRKYYIDDIAFGVYNSDNYYNPAVTPQLSSSDSVLSGLIDNGARAIVPIPDSYTVEDFMAAIDSPENIKVYDANGNRVTTGRISGCTVALSNGFGGAYYYSVSDHLVYREVTFDTVTSPAPWEYFSTGSTFPNSWVETLGGKGGKNLADKAGFLFTSGRDSVTQEEIAVNDTTAPRVDWIVGSTDKNLTDGARGVVTLEASIMPNMQYGDGRSYYRIGTNGASAGNLTIIATFSADGTLSILGNKLTWEPYRWYKIAVTFRSGSNKIDAYLNGKLIAEQYELASNVDFVARNRIDLYNTTGHDASLGIDNLRISYGEYKTELDEVLLTSTNFNVNNNRRRIYIPYVDLYEVNDLLSDLKGSNLIKVYTDGTMTEEATGLESGCVVVAQSMSGETFAYYTIVDAMFAETVVEPQLFKLQGVEIAPSGNVDLGVYTLTIPYEKFNSDTETIRTILALYDKATGKLLDVDTSDTNLEIGKGETLPVSIEVENTGVILKGMAWDGKMKPLIPAAVFGED